VSRPLLLSWSGGKDAAWALHTLRRRDDVDVVGLVTTLTEGYERIAMQGIRHALLRAQSEACGLPVIEAWMPQRADNATYRASFADALTRARERWPGLSDIAFGDLFLQDIRAWREAQSSAGRRIFRCSIPRPATRRGSRTTCSPPACARS
jgi:diphthamide synthase (EF-2-diphthine--ammonia ligase)